jgi:hypothetical protein
VVTKTSGNYISNREWLREAVKGQEVILRSTSALEYLRHFLGYLNENIIDVYARTQGAYENINYRIVDTFDNIEFINDGGILCCTFNQAVNDMLSDFDNPNGDADSEALTKALSRYYHANGKTFNGLYIEPANTKQFEYMKEWAIGYYDEY